MNKVCISILNCHPGNSIKNEGFWFVFKFFVMRFSLIFQKNGGGGGEQKIAHCWNQGDFDFFPDFYDQNLGLGATVDAEMGMKRAHKSNFYPSFGKRDHQYKRPFSPSFGKRAQPVSFFPHYFGRKKESLFEWTANKQFCFSKSAPIFRYCLPIAS